MPDDHQCEWRMIAETQDRQIERLQAEIKQLRHALGALCDEIEGLEEHGGGAHEDECPICVAIAEARKLSQ